MKKRRIVIASILKPVDDTRMYEKFALPLAESGKYEVAIIGYPTSAPIQGSPVQFYPSQRFRRISWARFIAPFSVARKVHQLRPELLIVNTPELLIVAVANRILFGTRIIYDVQENYYRNVRFTRAFLLPLRLPIAWSVRLKEKLLAPFFHSFFLAEKGYEKELRFTRGNHIVLENKCRLPTGFSRQPSPEGVRLLFSGTIAESTGVFQAVHLAEKLRQKDQSVTLDIIGYCSIPSVLAKLKSEIADKSFVRLTGGNRLVPHSEILDAISKAHFGIVFYPPSPHTINRVPTKIFEYAAARLPILLQNHNLWVERLAPYHAAIPFNFEQIDASSILHQMKTSRFYPQSTAEFLWETEAPKLVAKVSRLIGI